jgi:transposase-like protein
LLREVIDERMQAFLERPIEGEWPYLWIDATYVKVRQAGRVVLMAVTVAVGVNTDGRREVLGMGIGPSEAETFWTEFLRKLARRGLRGVKLVISDAHEGLKAAAARVLSATHQRCRVHFARHAPAHAGKNGRRVVSALMATAFAQDDAEAAKAQWRRVSDQLRLKLPKLAELMDRAEDDVLAYMSFPTAHRVKIHSVNPMAGEPGDQASHRGGRHLPQRGRARPPRRAPSCSSSPTNGPSSASATCRWKASHPSAMMPSSACPPWPPDQIRPSRRSR